MERKQRRPCAPARGGKLGGVCAGLAEYADADVALVRAAWVVLSIWPGAIVLGVIAYVAAWILMPRAETPPATTSRDRGWCARKPTGASRACAAVSPITSTSIQPSCASPGLCCPSLPGLSCSA